LGEVIKLASRIRSREAWDKPLTTEYATDKGNNVKLYYLKRHKLQAASLKPQATSSKRRATSSENNRK
jgi:hypothetical protein